MKNGVRVLDSDLHTEMSKRARTAVVGKSLLPPEVAAAVARPQQLDA